MLKVTAMPWKRDINNVSSEMIANLDPESALVKELNNIERLVKKSDLLDKTFRATNNYVRSKLNNSMPTLENLEQMIKDVSAAEKEQGVYNPVQCWNERDSQEDIKMLVTTFAQINMGILKQLSQDYYKNLIQKLMADPFINLWEFAS